MVMVRSLEPQEIADVSVQMCSPSRAGMYQGQWRMCTATGLYYGGGYVLMQAGQMNKAAPGKFTLLLIKLMNV